MTIEERHLLEKNKRAKLCATVLTAFTMLFIAITCIGGITAPLVFRFILGAVIIAVLNITATKLIATDSYRLVVTISMAILYLFTVFLATSSQIYIIMFSIIIIVLMYGKAQTVMIGCVIAIVGLFLSDLIDVKNGFLTGNDMFTQIMFATLACVVSVIFCKMQRRQNTETLDAIKEGADAQTQTSNEIVSLAENLNEKFVEAREVANKLNDAMEATHSSVMEIVEGTKNTAEAIEQQTSQTSDIQESIQAVGEEAVTIGEISEKVEASVREGVELIEQLKNRANEVAKINIETSETTQALNDSIQDVQAITETILGISSQTNLLALNASIEAARAGEAGKGFAVVADEIRALSESTREATEEIVSIITRLTTDAKSAADAMSRSADVANKQHELIEETGAKLSDIKSQTDELHEGVIQVRGSVSTVIDANTAIMDSITNLSATSEEVAASTDTVLSVSDTAMDALDGMNATLVEINNISQNMEEVAKN